MTETGRGIERRSRARHEHTKTRFKRGFSRCEDECQLSSARVRAPQRAALARHVCCARGALRVEASERTASGGALSARASGGRTNSVSALPSIGRERARWVPRAASPRSAGTPAGAPRGTCTARPAAVRGTRSGAATAAATATGRTRRADCRWRSRRMRTRRLSGMPTSPRATRGWAGS